jgi:uncharacterized membrane protein required for colicin V production
MKFDILPINWFDLVLLVWLVMGVFRGRKRGMSAEVLTFLQWIAIVIVCSILYAPVGDEFARMSHFSKLLCYTIAYLVLAGLVALVFLAGKRYIGGKLIGSDAFGKGEYYLGMPAGFLRFMCIMLFLLALLNARLYTQRDIEAYREFQMKNFDSEFFPGFQSLQAGVFEKSLTGPLIKKYLSFLLIKPTPPGGAKEYKQQEWKGPA